MTKCLIIHSLFSTGDSRPDIQVGGQHKMLYDCTIKQNFKGVGGGGGGPQKLQDFCNYKDLKWLKISAKTFKMLKLTIHIYTTTLAPKF